VYVVHRGVLNEVEALGPNFANAAYFAREHCQVVETVAETGPEAMKEAIGKGIRRSAPLLIQSLH